MEKQKKQQAGCGCEANGSNPVNVVDVTTFSVAGIVMRTGKKKKGLIEVHDENHAAYFLDWDELKGRAGVIRTSQTKKIDAYLNTEEGQAYVRASDLTHFEHFFGNSKVSMLIAEARREMQQNGVQ